jgi:exopolysaccharide biosynthesis polyprenyl glycosylphosphotransferase
VNGTASATYRLGLVATVIGLATLHSQVIDPAQADLIRTTRVIWWVLVTVGLAAATYGLGLPELPASRRDAWWRGAASAGVAMAVVSLFQLVLAEPLLPRSSLGLLAVLTPLWSLVGWNLAVDETNRRIRRDRVFVVAQEPSEHASLTYELAEQPEAPASVVGWSSVDDSRLTTDGSAPLEEAVDRVAATVVVLDTAAQSDDGIVQQVARLHGRGLRVRTLALFYEEWLGKLPVAELARVSLLFDIGELHRLRYVRSKRILDLVLGLIGLVAVVPVTALVVAGNRVANPGPLLYRQPRVGKDGKVFTIYKFRTMRPSGGGPATWTTEDDPRITPFGRFLRRTHLDELPQMINVLRGELSIVGPRPEQPHYVEELREKIPFYDVRHLVRPGLTGWAQVKQGYAADESDAYEKLQYDVYYLRRQGSALDVRIVWRTVRGILAGAGR